MSGQPFALALCALGFVLIGAAVGVAVLSGNLDSLWSGAAADEFLAGARGWAGALFIAGLAACLGGAMLLRAGSSRARMPGTL